MEDEPSPKDARAIDAEPKDAKQNAVSAQLPRLFSAFEQARASGKNASKWLADALSLLAAVQKLGHTLAKLIQHARRAAQQNLADKNATPETLLNDEIITDIHEQFQALIDEFPDAGELFFGIDKVDEFMSQFFDGSASPSLLGAASELGGFLDAQISGFIERLIDWAFDDGGGFRAEMIKFERIEAFVHGLENLMQEVLDRWVFPGFYDFDGDEDDDA